MPVIVAVRPAQVSVGASPRRNSPIRIESPGCIGIVAFGDTMVSVVAATTFDVVDVLAPTFHPALVKAPTI